MADDTHTEEPTWADEEPTDERAPSHPITPADVFAAPAGDEVAPAYSAATPPPAITSPMGPVVEASPTATPDEPQELGADGIPVSALDAGAEEREKMRRGEYDYSAGDSAEG